eukprot:TRINITY_DN12760_c0_g1_i2.p1 TRINITY_DN12760_c0_g1~~TRINITY_DN12760_c0_g1_i2.p1  ORF type:complete len:217 (+),score=81.27 TRINITY_DN12760_c0_g1_i2:856-1506(+)
MGCSCPFGVDMNFVKFVLHHRHTKIGKPLETLKKDMHYTKNGVDFRKKGSYRIEFDDKTNRAVSITFRTGAKVDLPEECLITRKLDFEANFSDMEASVRMEPMPPIPLHTFFKLGEGPHEYACDSKKAWLAYLKDLFAQFQKQHNVAATSDGQNAAEKIDQLKEEKKSETMSAARAAAKAKLGEKKAKRKLSLQKSDASHEAPAVALPKAAAKAKA